MERGYSLMSAGAKLVGLCTAFMEKIYSVII